VLSVDPVPPPPPDIEDVEEELAAALPQTQGTRFYPLIGRWALHVAPFIVLGAASYVLWREFHEISLGEIAGAMRAWGPGPIAAALALSATSFLLMGVVEWMGLRWVGAKVGVPSALAGSFMANAIAHTLGANLIVSGAIRARFYNRFGVTIRQVAAATLFHGLSFGVGLSTLAGMGLILAGPEDLARTRIAGPVADGLGLLLLLGVSLYVTLCATLRRPLRGFGHSVKLPSARVAVAQLLIGALDNAVAAAILWSLLPAGSVAFASFVGAYAPSVVLGLLSHVPGGVGVFEGSVSALLAGVEPAPLAAAFLGYRLAFFILPLAIAAMALAGDTFRQRGVREAR
jgi:uncharacterized membrane protein YbhN (UPF0104 family)